MKRNFAEISKNSIKKQNKFIYILKRQDDNGNIFIIEKYSTIEEAQEVLKRLTQNIHKQYYWIETDPKKL